jgi:ABC-type multidrug transport system fused ATPase/permease subunit
MSVVLQQPFVIASENIKNNLDPENRHSDEDVKQALTLAALPTFSPHSMTDNLSTG